MVETITSVLFLDTVYIVAVTTRLKYHIDYYG